MAEDHHVRIILEAVSRGSNNLREFFKGSDNEITKFRKSLNAAKKDIETFPGFGGTTVARGEGGRFVALSKDIDRSTNSLRKFREEAKRTFKESAVGRGFSGLLSGLDEERRIREEVNNRLNLSEQEKQRRLDAIDKETNSRKLKRINDLEKAEVGTIRRVIAAEEGRAASVIRDLRSEGRIIQNQINLHERLLSEKQLLNKEERKAAADSLRFLREERDGIDAQIRARQVERDIFVDSEKRKIAALHQRIREEENANRRTLRAGVLRPSPVAVEQEVRSQFSRDTDRDNDSFRRLGATVARTFG